MTTALRVACFAVMALLSTAGAASCRGDAQLKELQARIAAKHFPELLPRLPPIEMCDLPSDLPGAAGEFRSIPERIRVLRDSGIPVDVVVAHELGHALVHRLGLDHRGYGGHGAKWLRVMIRAVYADEATRSANLTDHYPGLLAVHARALRAERAASVTETVFDVAAFLQEKPTWLPWTTKAVD